MKKNLRIVSAAAALLAVAPVAATAIATPATTVSAAVNSNNEFTSFGAIKNGEVASHGLKLNGTVGKVTKNDIQSAINAALANNKNLGTNFTVDNVSGLEGLDKWAAGTYKVTFTIKSSATPNDAQYDYLGLAGQNRGLVSGDVAAGSTLKAVNFTVNLNLSNTATDDNSSEDINDGYFNQTIFAYNPNTAVNISAVATEGVNGNTIPFGGAINGNIVYTDAQSAQHTALLHGDRNTTVYRLNSTNFNSDYSLKSNAVKATQLRAGKSYVAVFNKVTINLGNSEAGKSVRFVLPKNAWFAKHDKNEDKNVKTVKVDPNGVADLGTVYGQFYAYDPTDMQEVHVYSVKTGNVVNSGSVTLHAVNGQLNVNSVYASLSQEYTASQLDKGQRSVRPEALIAQNDLRDQLKKQNIDVDPNGYFKAPASFTINFNAKSNNNGATASLPVTVNVDNAAQTPAANETTKNVTIMHISAIYDKNGVATHDPALRAYDTYSVVSETVTINGAKFYKLAGKDQYIKVGNVDGTSRSLKHNSYVYKSTGKRRGKTVLKKGSSVTTYGKSFMIAGHQMYRIGENQYVKKANF